MKKGIRLGNGITFENINVVNSDFPKEERIQILRCSSTNIIAIQEEIRAAKILCNINEFIIPLYIAKNFVGMIKNDAHWKNVVDEFGQYESVIAFYLDEPYAEKNLNEYQITFIRDYINIAAPKKKFIIGDIREILKKSYKPIPGIFYTYTSYTDTMFLLGKPLPFGKPDQSDAIKRLHKKVGDKLFMIWVYGQEKILCPGDEYKSLLNTAEQLNIPYSIIYFGDGQNCCYNNVIPIKTALYHLRCYFLGVNPYSLTRRVGKFFSRLWFIIKNGFKEN